MSDSLPPVSIQEAYIALGLNNELLATTLMGMYTVIYVGTLYIYVSKKSSRNWLVVASFTISYFVYLVTVGVTWFLLKRGIVDGDTRETIFLSVAVSGPIWATYVNNICQILITVMADGLMIWRCFNVWKRSFRAISLPLSLLFCEIGLDLAEIIIVPATHFNPTPSQARIIDIIISAALFVTFATTMVATVLIAYRIHSIASKDASRRSKSPLNHVLEILIQSAAAYSLAALAYAILIAIPFGNVDPLTFNEAEAFLGPFYFFISGVAPTVMVARVALASDRIGDAAVSRVSGLQFRSDSAPTLTQFGQEPLSTNTRDAELLGNSQGLGEKIPN